MAVGVSVHPNGKFAYATNSSSRTIAAYTIDAATGTLRVIEDAPAVTAVLSGSISVHPGGQFAYVANVSGNTVSAYTIR